MARPHHAKNWYIHIDDPLSPSSEILFKDHVMNSAHYWRLEYVYFMANHFEYVIAEEFRDPRVSFEDFGLGLFVSTNDDDSCVISEHHVELIAQRLVFAASPLFYLILIEEGLSTARRACLHYEFFALRYIIFNLNQIVPVELKGLGVI